MLILVSAVAFLLAGFNVAGNAIGVWDPVKPRGTDAGLAARPPSIRTPHVGDQGTGTRTTDLAHKAPRSPISVHLALLIAFASLGFALLPAVSSRSVEWMARKRFRFERGPSRVGELRARASWLSELPARSRGWRHAGSAPPQKGPEKTLPHAASKAPARTAPEAPARAAPEAPARAAPEAPARAAPAALARAAPEAPARTEPEAPARTEPEAPAHTGPKRSLVGARDKANGGRLAELDFDRVRCHQCGYEAAQNDRFCAHCGASLGDARAPRSLVVMPAAETSGWETCEIDCWRGYVKCDFYARGLTPTWDEEVGRSPSFWWWHRDPPPQERSALAAHEALVERLLADGWVPTGTRRPWYAQRFRRSLDGVGAPVPEEAPALQSSSKRPGSP